MSEHKEEYGEFDDLFRRKLENLDPQFDESAWEAMEAKLDAEMPANAQTQPKIGFWAWGKYLVAALFIGAVGLSYVYWPSQPKSTIVNSKSNLDKEKTQNIDNQSFKRKSAKELKAKNSQTTDHQYNTDGKSGKVVDKINAQTTDNQLTMDNNSTVVLSEKNSQTTNNQNILKKNSELKSNKVNPQIIDNQKVVINNPNIALDEKKSQVIDNQYTNKENSKNSHQNELTQKKLQREKNNELITQNEANIKNDKLNHPITESTRETITLVALQSQGFQAIQPTFIPLEISENQLIKLQTNANVNVYKAIRFAFSAGIEVDKFTLDKKLNASPQIGVLVEMPLSPRLTILSGLQYNPKHYQISDFLGGNKLLTTLRVGAASPNTSSGFAFNGLSNFNQLYEGTKIKMELVDIPIELRYYLGKKSPKGLFISAGVNSYWMLRQAFTNDFRAEFLSDNNGDILETNIFDVIDTRNYFYPLSHLQFGVGWEFTFSKKVSTQIHPHFRTALRPIGLESSQFNTVGLRTMWFLSL
jgi:hypothetical protein